MSHESTKIIGEDGNVEEAIEFIKQEFMQRNLNKSKTNIYTHLTTATDTSNIKVNQVSNNTCTHHAHMHMHTHTHTHTHTHAHTHIHTQNG